MKIIPLTMGSLGAIPKEFGKREKKTGITAEIGQVQKTVLLGMARILRMKGYWLLLDFERIFHYSFTVS